METTIWRRHSDACPHKLKGRAHLKCNCPLWADGYRNGMREFRQSLNTRDMARARKRLATLESTEDKPSKSVKDAAAAFMAHCRSHAPSTQKRYRVRLLRLTEFCERETLDTVREVGTIELDAFRAGRPLKPITASKELETLRQFFAFCQDRGWTEDNPARKIKSPRNIQPNDVEPFTPDEVSRIRKAAETFGQETYERLRATAMILALRYTALRVGDIAKLKKDRIAGDGRRWRILLRTEKTGKPIYLPVPAELVNALDCVPSPSGAPEDCPYYFWNGVQSEVRLKEKIARSLRAVFDRSKVKDAHAHRFRHTLATEMLERGATFEDVADVLGNSPAVVRKHYAKWSSARQERISKLMEQVHGSDAYEAHVVVQ